MLLIASNVVLAAWIAVLGLVVLSLLRQIGVLHERTSPAGDLLGATLVAKQTSGLPDISILRLDGERVRSAALIRGTLVMLFVAPECQVCKPLVSVFSEWIERLQHRDDESVGYFVTAAAAEVARGYAQEHAQPIDRWLISERLGLELNATQTPWLIVMQQGQLLISQKIANRMQLDRSIDSVVNTALYTSAAQARTGQKREEQHGLA